MRWYLLTWISPGLNSLKLKLPSVLQGTWSSNQRKFILSCQVLAYSQSCTSLQQYTSGFGRERLLPPLFVANRFAVRALSREGLWCFLDSGRGDLMCFCRLLHLRNIINESSCVPSQRIKCFLHLSPRLPVWATRTEQNLWSSRGKQVGLGR